MIEHEESDDRDANPSISCTGNEASDGFETASDADLDSDGEDGGASSRKEQQRREQQHNLQQKQLNQTEQEQEQDVPERSISSEDASVDEEELRQVRFRNLGFSLFVLLCCNS